MRYYKLEIKIKNQWKLIDELSSSNPNALNIVLDSTETSGRASANITLSISNPPNSLLTTSFINNQMRLTAGLKSALPLANAKQIGLVMQGLIIQQIPNITEITKTITYKLISYPPRGDYEIVATAGSKVSTLITQTLLPFGTQVIIDKTLESVTTPFDIVNNFPTFALFCDYLFKVFEVEVTTKRGAYLFFVGKPSSQKIVNIQWQDLIGQPVGESVAGNLSPNTQYKIGIVQIPCNARGDLSVGDIVNLRVGAGNSQAISTSDFNAVGATGLDYTGEYVVLSIRHKLESRSTNPESWCTTITGAING